MSTISPKGMKAAIRRSLVVSDGREETWIVHFIRCVAVAAIVLGLLSEYPHVGYKLDFSNPEHFESAPVQILTIGP